jgi:hypothetical protein
MHKMNSLTVIALVDQMFDDLTLLWYKSTENMPWEDNKNDNRRTSEAPV